MLKQTDRQNTILEILKEQGYASIKEIAERFGVSEMTVRRDFKCIGGNKAVKNVNGMLVYASPQKAYELNTEEVKNNREKIAIGRFAASLVQPDDIIIIDTGTTTVHVAANLPTNFNITALCYNSNVLWQLQRFPHVQVLMAGGHYHANTQMFESAQGIRFIKEIRANKVFISAAGIHADLGLTCAEGYEVTTKKAVLQSVAQKILVADYTKFGAIKPSYFCSLGEIDAIVTNQALDKGWAEHIRERGIRLYLV